jgi:hypothetical protein
LFNENDIISAPFGGQALFGGQSGTTFWEPDAEDFQYHISRGTKKLAPMILRGTDAEEVDDVKGIEIQKWSEIDRVFPLVESFGNITSKQIAKRVKGERSFDGLTKEERTRILAREVHKISLKECYFTMEYLAWQSILTGTQPVLIGATSTDLQYNFYRNPAHFVTGTNWTTSSTDLLGDLDTYWRLINNNGNLNAQVLACGDTVIKSIVSNDDVFNFADNRRYGHMNIETPLTEAKLLWLQKNGLEYRGYVTTKTGKKFFLFTYTKTYTDSAGATQKYLPDDKAVMFSIDNQNDRHFGPSDDMPLTQQQRADYIELVGADMDIAPMGLDIETTAKFDPRWFYFSLDRTRKSYKIITQIAPVYVPVTTDGWVTITIT